MAYNFIVVLYGVILCWIKKNTFYLRIIVKQKPNCWSLQIASHLYWPIKTCLIVSWGYHLSIQSFKADSLPHKTKPASMLKCLILDQLHLNIHISIWVYSIVLQCSFLLVSCNHCIYCCYGFAHKGLWGRNYDMVTGIFPAYSIHPVKGYCT